MKRQLTLIVLSLFLLAGCQKGELLPTEIKVEAESIDGTEYTLVIAGCEEGELTTAATVVRFIYHPDNIEMLSIEEVDDLGSGRLRNNSRQMESRTTAAPSSRLSLLGKARAGLARNGKARD